jgi:hypothetical protein
MLMFRQVIEVQALVKRAVGTKQKVAQGPIAPAFGLIMHRRMDLSLSLNCAPMMAGERNRPCQLLGQFGVKVVGNARCRVVADLKQ